MLPTLISLSALQDRRWEPTTKFSINFHGKGKSCSYQGCDLISFVRVDGAAGSDSDWDEQLLSLPTPLLTLLHSDIYLEKLGHSGVFWNEAAGTFHGWKHAMARAIFTYLVFTETHCLKENLETYAKISQWRLTSRNNSTWVLFDGANKTISLVKEWFSGPPNSSAAKLQSSLQHCLPCQQN